MNPRLRESVYSIYRTLGSSEAPQHGPGRISSAKATFASAHEASPWLQVRKFQGRCHAVTAATFRLWAPMAFSASAWASVRWYLARKTPSKHRYQNSEQPKPQQPC